MRRFSWRSRRVGPLLIVAAFLLAVGGCGSDEDESSDLRELTLTLDFTPNAVHTGIYSALSHGYYRRKGIDLSVRQPGESSDAPKLLAAGRTDFAILDIHDLGIAREHGLDIVGLMPIVQAPLAAVIARGDGPVRRPRDLDGHTVGVTGLPSDEAVVDSEVAGNGGNPGEVKRVTIGFNAVSSLAAGKVDAATGFWNAEGVALRRQGVPVRIFKVDSYGAPRYPELVLATSGKTARRDPRLIGDMLEGTTRGYEFVDGHPRVAVEELTDAVPSLDRAEQEAELRAVLPDLHPYSFASATLEEWVAWDVKHGLLGRPLDVDRAFYGFVSN